MLDDAIADFIESVRLRVLERNESVFIIALYVRVPERDAWRRIVIDPGGMSRDTRVLWAANRTARLLRADVAVIFDECGVSIERRDAAQAEVFTLARGGVLEPADPGPDWDFDILPGGPPGIGLGWQQHDDLHPEDETEEREALYAMIEEFHRSQQDN